MTTMAVSTDVIEYGSIGLDKDELVPPELRFNGKKGEFYIVGDEGSPMKSYSAVPLVKLGNTRKKFSDDETSSEIECSSSDFAYPDNPEQASGIGAGPTCVACIFSRWGKDEKTGKAIKPACTEFREFLFASVPEEEGEEPAPFKFAVKSLSIKTLITALSAIEYRRKKMKPQKPAYAFALLFSSGDEVQRGRQNWYPLKIEPEKEPIPDEWLPTYDWLYQVALGMAHRRIQETYVAAEQAPMFDQYGDAIETQATPVQVAEPAQPATSGKPASDQQINAIQAIARSKRMAPDVLKAYVMEQYGCELHSLSGTQASQLIQALQKG